MTTLDASQVDDVLVYEDKVIVKTGVGPYEFPREEEGSDILTPRDSETPQAVLDALNKRGFELEPDFPKEITVYAHDEPTPYEREEIAETLGLGEEHELAKDIAGLTYEISLTVEVQDEDTAVVTHYDGHELKEPRTI